MEWRLDDGLAVAVDPYTEKDRQEATFDADLDETDVIAVHVSVENRTPRKVLVRASDMALVLPDGKALAPAGVTTTVNKVGESGSVVGSTIAFGLIGALVSSNAETNARAARTADYRDKAFKDTTLAQGELSFGFVFFIPPPGTKPFDTATLRVRFVDFDTASSRTVEAAMAGLDYEETKEKKKNDDQNMAQ